MQIEITIKGIDEFLRKFDTRIVQKAVETTLIRTAKLGKTEISKQIRQRFNIQKQDLDRKIDVELKGLENLEAKLIVTGRPINLMYFNPTQSKKGGVNVTIVKRTKQIATRIDWAWQWRHAIGIAHNSR